jgi:hypothetical protein
MRAFIVDDQKRAGVVELSHLFWSRVKEGREEGRMLAEAIVSLQNAQHHALRVASKRPSDAAWKQKQTQSTIISTLVTVHAWAHVRIWW